MANANEQRWTIFVFKPFNRVHVSQDDSIIRNAAVKSWKQLIGIQSITFVCAKCIGFVTIRSYPHKAIGSCQFNVSFSRDASFVSL